jgi:serine/threonine-protein kinase HipA
VSTEVAVDVAVGERNLLAGWLRSDGGRGTPASFAYDAGYLSDPDAYPLDPALPLVGGTMTTAPGRVTFGAFADSAPDGWGRSLVTRTEAARAQAAGADPPSLGELDVLTTVRDDLRQGALRYRHGEYGPFLADEVPGAPTMADLPALLGLAARFEQDGLGLADLERLLWAGGSIGGWRPKVHFTDEAGRVAIAKFPKVGWDSWDVMAWEKVAHDLARAAGISLPDSELIRVGDAHVFVVTRFDRRGAARIGYASARTMLSAAYGDQRSYLQIADVISERSPAADADLHELWRRVVFSVLVSNTDDHLRNHGFLHQRGESWALSPAFDLNPDPRPGPKHLSTAIDGTDTSASVDAALRVAGHFRLDEDAALDVLAEVSRAATGWREVAAAQGLQAEDVDAMAPAFEHAESDRARDLTAGRLSRRA